MLRLIFLNILVLLQVVLSQFHEDVKPSLSTATLKPGPLYAGAPVHYVNIGAQLAGDYKFAYDTGKGPSGQSFREETRLADGTVKGAYGIVDDQGRQRIIRYSAGKDGFTAEGDVGPDGAPKGTAPGPAPQGPTILQMAPIAEVQRPSSPKMQYVVPLQPATLSRRNDGEWDAKLDDEYYDENPAFIDIGRLSYNIGLAKQN